jgi:hypothetical protein
MTPRHGRENSTEGIRMRKGTFVIEDQFGPYPGYTTGARTRWRRRRIGCGSFAGPMSAGAFNCDGSRLRRGGGKSDDGTGEI